MNGKRVCMVQPQNTANSLITGLPRPMGGYKGNFEQELQRKNNPDQIPGDFKPSRLCGPPPPQGRQKGKLRTETAKKKYPRPDPGLFQAVKIRRQPCLERQGCREYH